MSVSTGGIITPIRRGIFGAIEKQLKTIKLTAVKKIEVNFDPFLQNSKDTRDFLFRISSRKIRSTNPKCTIKTTINCNREEPFIDISLVKGETYKFKAGNLKILEILQLYNKYITPHNPVEVEETTLKTKSQKAGKRKIK